jgi:hypothetical protein
MDLDRQYGRDRFTTKPPVVDRTDGFTALRLYQTVNGSTTVCAEIIYWDACGQFVLQTFEKEVPLDVIEELIAEAKDTIRLR